MMSYFSRAEFFEKITACYELDASVKLTRITGGVLVWTLRILNRLKPVIKGSVIVCGCFISTAR